MIGTDTKGIGVFLIVSLIESLIGSVISAGITFTAFLTEFTTELAVFVIALTGADTIDPIFNVGRTLAVLFAAFRFAFILFRTTDCYNDFLLL